MPAGDELVRSLILLFDPITKLNVKRLISLSHIWFDICGMKPNYVTIVGEGFSGKPMSHQRAKSKLASPTIDNADDVSISAIPGGKQFNNNEKCQYSLYVLSNEPSLCTTNPTISFDQWIAAAKPLLDLGSLQYGYYYALPRRLHPVYYAAGIISSIAGDTTPPHEEKLQIAKSMERSQR
jgi:hypothetical protein